MKQRHAQELEAFESLDVPWVFDIGCSMPLICVQWISTAAFFVLEVCSLEELDEKMLRGGKLRNGRKHCHASSQHRHRCQGKSWEWNRSCWIFGNRSQWRSLGCPVASHLETLTHQIDMEMEWKQCKICEVWSLRHSKIQAAEEEGSLGRNWKGAERRSKGITGLGYHGYVPKNTTTSNILKFITDGPSWEPIVNCCECVWMYIDFNFGYRALSSAPVTL